MIGFFHSFPMGTFSQIPVANRTAQMDSRTRLYKFIAYPLALLVPERAST
jgi:hypothetical protein